MLQTALLPFVTSLILFSQMRMTSVELSVRNRIHHTINLPQKITVSSGYILACHKLKNIGQDCF